MTHGKYIISGFFFVAKIDFSKISVILESPFFFTKKQQHSPRSKVEALHQNKNNTKKNSKNAVDDVDSEVMEGHGFPKRHGGFSNFFENVGSKHP